MQLLMAKDEKAYRALIDETKDKRLHLLLAKTDEHMDMMKSMVGPHSPTPSPRASSRSCWTPSFSGASPSAARAQARAPGQHRR
jgi:hypothetical protein